MRVEVVYQYDEPYALRIIPETQEEEEILKLADPTTVDPCYQDDPDDYPHPTWGENWNWRGELKKVLQVPLFKPKE